MSANRTGGIVTLIAVAFAAYLLADLAHEGLGHGGMCVALGGHLNLLSTTYEDCSIRSRLIDGAGPIAGIFIGLLAGAWFQFASPRGPQARFFLCLVFAFTMFWNVGYMLKSGLTDKGDWAFVIAGFAPAWAWHAGLTLLGIVLYAAAMRVLAAMLAAFPPAGDARGLRPFSIALIAYGAAAFLSAAGAFFDPRGPATIATDALPSSLGSVGLVWVGYLLNRRLPGLRIAMPVSPAWIAAGSLSAIIFVAVLGPGLSLLATP